MLTLTNQFVYLFQFNKRTFTIVLVLLVALILAAVILAPSVIAMAGPAGSNIDHCSC